MDPVTVIVPSDFLLVRILTPLPATVRALFTTLRDVVIGSSATSAWLPAPGDTATQTTFSLSESPLTRAAYAAPRYLVSQPLGTSESSNAVASPTMSPVTFLMPAATTCCANAAIGAFGPPSINRPDSEGSPSPRRMIFPRSVPSLDTEPSRSASVL